MKQILSKQTKRFLWDLIFPNKCPVCSQVIRWDKVICDECKDRLPFIDQNEICHKCAMKHPPEQLCETEHCFDNTYGIIWYDGIGKRAMYNFKRRYALNLAEFCAPYIYELLEKECVTGEVDCITYVPMHIYKENKRGYNQAQELAQTLSQALDIPVIGGFLEHRKSSVQQHELTGGERREQAKETYTSGSTQRDPNNKVCILVDDIFTTGSTLDVCSKLLKEKGFEKVICVTVCITPYKLVDDEYENDYDSEYYD